MTPEEACRRYQETENRGERPFHLKHDTLETEFYRPWEKPRKFKLSLAQIFWAWIGVVMAIALFVWVSYKHFGAIL